MITARTHIVTHRQTVFLSSDYSMQVYFKYYFYKSICCGYSFKNGKFRRNHIASALLNNPLMKSSAYLSLKCAFVR